MAFRIVVAGASLGGFRALKAVLGGLPKDFPLPIVVVQHRNLEQSELLAALLATHVSLPVVEIHDKQEIKDGRIFVGPSNYHVLIDGDHLALSTEAPVSHARPSIDVLFESAAESFGEGVLAVLLTGMSGDGSAGLKRIKECGGYTLAQDPLTAKGRVVPKVAIESPAFDEILPLEKIASFMMDLSMVQRINA
ncbi:MAG: chemotaxis protein CheB [Acidobacteria bacterium]|nr:MAG: chemotaxis protein CheB [Acidobacteriota bacterium]